MWEIYACANNRVLMVEELKTHQVLQFSEMPRAWIKQLDQAGRNAYPETWAELDEHFGSEPEKAYIRTYTFCACNFCEKDGQVDIDEEFNFIIENVFCPVRHLCKRTTCKPKLSSDLTRREVEIIGLFSKAFGEEEIAERLFIEKCTVHNHINNIYDKTGFRGKSNPDRRLIAYALKNNIV